MPRPRRVDALNLIHPARPVGWKGLMPFAVLAGGTRGACEVTLDVQPRSGPAAAARATVGNGGKAPVRLRAIRWVADIASDGICPPIQFPADLEPFYYASENFRADHFGTGTRRGNRYMKPMPCETVELGDSEDLVFPGLFIGSEVEPIGLLCAAATNRRFHVRFRLRGGDGTRNFGFEIEEQPTGLDALEIAPGETVVGEQVFFAVVETNDPQQSTDGYYALLRENGEFSRLPRNPLPKQRIWCSWNFGYMDRITEADVLKQLPVIAKRFPMVKFVQIDHGYERVYGTGGRALVDFLYETEEPYDKAKFPGGPKELARRIKDAGLRPATWIAGWAAGDSKLIADHPDWVLRDDMGRRIAYRSRFGSHGRTREILVLDPSIPEVRDYYEFVSRTVFQEWEFEGLKFDFYSFPYMVRRARFAVPGKTQAEWKRWMIETFRKYLPEDGFLGLCSVAGTGTPLLGVGADYFRCAEDIGDGDWDLAKRIAAWDANTNMLMPRCPVPANIDSIGWSAGFDETTWKSFLNLCAVSGQALELAGDLTQLDSARIERLERTLELSDPSRKVRCLDIPRGVVELPPSIWLAEGDRDALLAIFNWSDARRLVDLTPLASFDLDAFASAWPGEGVKLRGRALELDAHESVLLGRGV